MAQASECTRLWAGAAQRSFEIWSFAFVFFFKLWLSGKKWSYGKAGMTEARISERKTKLAAWLREGLIKLGPTFIKIGARLLRCATCPDSTAWRVLANAAQRHARPTAPGRSGFVT